MISFFKITLFVPLYNLLLFITSSLPGESLGFAIIILTILVKVLIFPLYAVSVRTQLKMKAIDPKLKEIKSKYKDNLPEQSKKIMELYKEEKINPFSGILVLFIQLPIILSLFYVFKDSLVLQSDLIYSFVTAPSKLGTNFLGFIDLSASRNLLLAGLTWLTQYIQVSISLPTNKKEVNANSDKNKNFGQDFAKSMELQMRYVMPLMIAFFAYSLPAAISLYWITGNIFSAIYEASVIKKIKSKY